MASLLPFGLNSFEALIAAANVCFVDAETARSKSVKGLAPIVAPNFSGPVRIGVGSAQTVKLSIGPAAFNVATDGIKFVSFDNTTHCFIQPVKAIGGAMNLSLGANVYVDTAGSEQRFNAGAASGFINIRSNDGSIRFATSGAGGGPVERAQIDALGNVIIGSAAIATTATDGFLYVPTCAGAPTGVPTAFTGRSPIVIDTTNIKLWAYIGGAWKGVVLA